MDSPLGLPQRAIQNGTMRLGYWKDTSGVGERDHIAWGSNLKIHQKIYLWVSSCYIHLVWEETLCYFSIIYGL